ncbi:MAG: asparagine synthase (glutamine-hydrolyzing) [Gemmatimonadota bacterium]
MCGIYGMVLKEGHAVREDLLHAAVRALRHRGPDGSGVYVSPCRRVGLAHTRLAIIDRADGHQPMATADGRLHLIYNGEIYNHQLLRRQLEAEGVAFATHCDTEALLHLYDRHRAGCLPRLEGMFAFATWDERQRTFFGARDRLGQKPVYYLERPEGLYFASEIWPLLATPGYEPAIDLEALQQYLNYYLPLAPRTMLRDIRRLPPACAFRYDGGRLAIERYWHPCYRRKRREGEADLVAECRDLLETAVAKRLMSEVPLGAMLSGGLDSSAVSALACRAGTAPLRTFSAFYRDARGRDMDWEYAQLVAAHLGTEHTNLLYDEQDLLDLLPAVCRHFGEPYGSFNGAISLAISRLMKEHVTVVLSGNGGDEVFAGYNTYRQVARLDRPALRAALSLVPAAPFRRLYERGSRHLPPSDGRWQAIYLLSHPDRRVQRVAHSELYLRRRLLAPEAARGLPPVEDALAEVFGAADADSVLDRWTFGDLMGRMQENMVTRPDLTGMAASVEIRAPLLDHHLVEFAASLPSDLRLHRGRVGKHLLREAVRPLLPPPLFTRPKQGFSGVTYEQLVRCVRGRWRAPFGAALFDHPAPLSAGLLQEEEVRSLWRAVLEEPEAAPRTTRSFQLLWMLVSLRLWESEVASRPR